MYDLTKIQSALSHFQSISNIFEDKGSHYMMFCQFCDDATRKANPGHGHLYVSKELPVYYCQRCGAAGTILNLLITTGFDDNNTLEYISSFLKYKFTRDYYKDIGSTKKKRNYLNKYLSEQIKKLKTENNSQYERFLNYLNQRIGAINFSYFLIVPDYVNILTKSKINLTFFSCCFNNYDGEFSTARIIDENQYFRFKNNNRNNLYYFQKQDFEEKKSIVFTEGPFDIINLYTYNNNFLNHETFFASVNGKKFLSNIEKIILQELLIGSFDINIVFDNDDKYHLRTLNKARVLAKNLNSNIHVRGWLPSLNYPIKDVSDYPNIKEI